MRRRMATVAPGLARRLAARPVQRRFGLLPHAAASAPRAGSASSGAGSNGPGDSVSALLRRFRAAPRAGCPACPAAAGRPPASRPASPRPPPGGPSAARSPGREQRHPCSDVNPETPVPAGKNRLFGRLPARPPPPAGAARGPDQPPVQPREQGRHPGG
jgi:hypothetical protein